MVDFPASDFFDDRRVKKISASILIVQEVASVHFSLNFGLDLTFDVELDFLHCLPWFEGCLEL